MITCCNGDSVWHVNHYGNRFAIERYAVVETEWHGGWNEKKSRPNTLYESLDEARLVADELNADS